MDNTLRWYVDDGCHTEADSVKDDFAGTYRRNSFNAGVRCCSMDGASCKTIGKCPGGSATHDHAVDKCEGMGMRLCTKDELLDGICCGKGGRCDNHPVWTSTLESGY